VLLEMSDLVTEFATSRGVLRAVDHVSLTLERGEVLGLVGESGSGKSVIAQSIMGLIEPPGRIAGGRITFDGQDLLRSSRAALRRLRGARIAMVFQDPTSTLNPVLTVGEQVAELLRHHTRLGRAERRAGVIAMLERVGIADAAARYHAYPHELSGGMQQRVIIACALILHPELVIADEPTTALDVTVQAQILDVLRRLKQSERNTAILLITHDIGVVAQMCERVAVIYAGSIVETAPTRAILHRPRHPYTTGLIASIPRPGMAPGALRPIPGVIADSFDRPGGCAFHPRCRRAMPCCAVEPPPLRTFADGSSVACHLTEVAP
jgi:oligopeptide/dipeptide ABC transporter ATP-binding protein